MLFRRRHKASPLSHVGNLMWPRIGWRRATSYVVHRLKRMSGSPHSIAAGLACGVAVSCTPFLGFHIILAALLACVARGNILASAAGTMTGNPWTFPLIWIWTYRLGSWILDGGEMKRGLAINADIIFNHPVTLLLPMTVGGVLTGAVAGIAVYVLLKPLIAAYQLRRASRRQGRAEGRGAAARLLGGTSPAGKRMTREAE